MTLLAMSDLHGELLDPSTLPRADVAVIAGDITPVDHKYYGATMKGVLMQAQWIERTFIPWLATLPVAHVVLTWGNHDHIGEHPELLPDSLWPARMHMLVNQHVTIDGVMFYGVPQTPWFHDWAFNDDDTQASLGRRWAQVPDGTDVLVSHGPPYGVCDTASRGGPPLGSATQQAWLESEATNRPRLVICGHIHGSSGRSGMCGTSQVYNVALVNEDYRVVHAPRVLTVD